MLFEINYHPNPVQKSNPSLFFFSVYNVVKIYQCASDCVSKVFFNKLLFDSLKTSSFEYIQNVILLFFNLFLS